MKIAMIGQKGIPAIYGGVERHVEELAKELAGNGHAIFVYTRPWYSKQTEAKALPGNIIVVHTPTIHTKYLDTIVHTFVSTLHALWRKADVIHYHGVGPALVAWIPRLLSPRTKVVATFHSIDRYHQKWGPVARLILKWGEHAACVFPHATIAVCRTIYHYCINEYQKVPVYIPNGVRLLPTPPAATLAQWNLQPNKYILMVSRLVPHKGAHYLIRAWKTVKAQYPKLLNGYQLVITGGSSFTDEYVTALHAQARGDNSIVFTGWQSGQALEALYGHAALFVHPSENEGLPITILQAMSFGKAVLASNIPEHQELITDARFWFANTSVSALSERLTMLMQQPELIKETGEHNKKLVAEYYQWPKIAAETEQVYSTLLKYNPTSPLTELKAA